MIGRDGRRYDGVVTELKIGRWVGSRPISSAAPPQIKLPMCAVCKRPVQWIGSSRVESLGRTYWRVRCHGAEEETWLDDAEAVRAGSHGVVIGEAFAGAAPRLAGSSS